MDVMQLLVLVILALLIAVNTFASVVVARSNVLVGNQRVLQIIFIWLIPVIGAIVCLAVASTGTADGSIQGKFDPLYRSQDGATKPDPGGIFPVCSGGGDGGGDGGD